MARGTPATVALQKAGIVFTLHEYDYDPGAERIGLQAAQALGVDPARLFKTLMARAGATVLCVLVPSDREASLKRLAAAAGAKDAALMPTAEAERVSGYRVGGISPTEEARALFARQGGAGPRDHDRQRRPARPADRACAGGPCPAARRGGVSDVG